MIIVSNTSPLSNLAKVGQINLLEQLYKTVRLKASSGKLTLVVGS